MFLLKFQSNKYNKLKNAIKELFYPIYFDKFTII